MTFINFKTNKQYQHLCGALALMLCGGFFVTSSAQAGFEWKPPVQEAQQAIPPSPAGSVFESPPALPAATVKEESLQEPAHTEPVHRPLNIKQLEQLPPQNQENKEVKTLLINDLAEPVRQENQSRVSSTPARDELPDVMATSPAETLENSANRDLTLKLVSPPPPVLDSAAIGVMPTVSSEPSPEPRYLEMVPNSNSQASIAAPIDNVSNSSMAVSAPHVLQGSKTVKRNPLPVLIDQNAPSGHKPSVVITGNRYGAPAVEVYDDYSRDSVVILDSTLSAVPHKKGSQPAFTRQQSAGAIQSSSKAPLPITLPANNEKKSATQWQPAVIQGFAENIPLIIALRQVVPEDYELQFASDVNVDTLVSWQGGRTWQEVTADMLATENLAYALQEDSIEIYPKNQREQNNNFGQLPSIPVETVKVVAGEQQAESNFEQARVDLPQANFVANEQGTASMSAFMPDDSAVTQAEKPIPAVLETVTYQAPDIKKVKSSPQIWYGAKDSTLRNVLSDWASKANIELFWDTEFDYPIHATVVLTGSFEEAVQNLLEGFDQSRPRPLGRLHKNNNQGPAVLLIEANDLAN